MLCPYYIEVLKETNQDFYRTWLYR